jgi:hypothetical protein
MVKSALIYPWHNDEKEVNLTGAYYYYDNSVFYVCEDFHLNISACNGYNVSSIEIDLTHSNNQCITADAITFFYYKDNGDVHDHNEEPPLQVPIQLSDPLNYTAILNLDPIIPACSSAAVKFRICFKERDCFGEVYNVDIKIPANPPCTNTLTFVNDEITGVKKILNYDIYQGEDKLGVIHVNYNSNDTVPIITYRIINVINSSETLVETDSRDTALNILQTSSLPAGLYILQKLENGSPIYSEKISIGF